MKEAFKTAKAITKTFCGLYLLGAALTLYSVEYGVYSVAELMANSGKRFIDSAKKDSEDSINE